MNKENLRILKVLLNDLKIREENQQQIFKHMGPSYSEHKMELKELGETYHISILGEIIQINGTFLSLVFSEEMFQLKANCWDILVEFYRLTGSYELCYEKRFSKEKASLSYGQCQTIYAKNKDVFIELNEKNFDTAQYKIQVEQFLKSKEIIKFSETFWYGASKILPSLENTSLNPLGYQKKRN